MREFYSICYLVNRLKKYYQPCTGKHFTFYLLCVMHTIFEREEKKTIYVVIKVTQHRPVWN